MTRFAAILLVLGTIATLGAAPPARADNDSFTLTITGGRFEPAEIVVPTGRKLTLVVKNLDATASEFESTDLGREKVVTAASSVTVFIGPLRAGRYEFFDDFKPDTPHGFIVAQ